MLQRELSIKNLVETPQPNGIIERKHQHILNVARALLFQAKLPSIFSGDSVHTAIHCQILAKKSSFLESRITRNHRISI